MKQPNDALQPDPMTKHPISTANFFDHHAAPEDIAVMVTEQDFLDAHRELIPSVSAGELQHYERVKATFEGGQGEKKNSVRDVASGDGMRPRSSGKGKSRSRPVVDRKGKGKAVVRHSQEEEEEENDEDDDEPSVYYEAHDNGKGKGKAVARFHEGTASDDEGLY
jgi:peroxin-6